MGVEHLPGSGAGSGARPSLPSLLGVGEWRCAAGRRRTVTSVGTCHVGGETQGETHSSPVLCAGSAAAAQGARAAADLR